MNQPDNFKNATRCQHTKMNGQPCSAPARRGRRFCIFHDAANRKPQDFAVPILEDATSLQFAILQVMRALADKAIEPKTAALMLYGLQIAASNLRRFAEEQSPAHGPDDEPSLLRSLLDQLQIPQYQQELERERAWEKLHADQPQLDDHDHQSAAGNQPPIPGFPFDIKACAEPADGVARVFDPRTRVEDPRHIDPSLAQKTATPKPASGSWTLSHTSVTEITLQCLVCNRWMFGYQPASTSVIGIGSGWKKPRLARIT